MKKNTKREKSAAFHEAGHAVAYCVLGHEFLYSIIELGEDPHGKTRGKYTPEWDEIEMNADKKTKDFIHEEIIITLAGYAAERHFAGRNARFSGSSKDYDDVCNLAVRVSGSLKETNTLMNRLVMKAESLVCQPYNEAAIKSVAAALLKHKRLSSAKIHYLYRQACTSPSLRKTPTLRT